MLGDHNNIYAQVFTALLPSSILFAPLFGMSLSKKGFAFAFSLMLLLGFIWSIVTLVPSLQAQLVAFLAFTNYRAMLYSAHFTFLAHTFGNRTFGRVNAILSVLAALLSGLIGPSASFSQQKIWQFSRNEPLNHLPIGALQSYDSPVGQTPSLLSSWRYLLAASRACRNIVWRAFAVKRISW